ICPDGLPLAVTENRVIHGGSNERIEPAVETAGSGNDAEFAAAPQIFGKRYRSAVRVPSSVVNRNGRGARDPRVSVLVPRRPFVQPGGTNGGSHDADQLWNAGTNIPEVTAFCAEGTTSFDLPQATWSEEQRQHAEKTGSARLWSALTGFVAGTLACV